MSEFVGHSRKLGSASLIATLLLATSSLWAQTAPQPTDPAQPTGEPTTEKPPPEMPPPPPPPPPEAPKTYPTVLPSRDIKLTEHFAIRLGLQAQIWYEAQQVVAEEASGDQGYENNFFCRRCRVLLNVQPWDNINLFVLLEAGNLGKLTGAGTSKNFTPNLAVLDAYAAIKFSEAFELWSGLMLVPLSRNGLQGTTTYIGLDVLFTAAQHVAAAQTAVLRDVGLMVKGYVLGEKLGYRAGVWSGIRDQQVQMPMMPLQSTASENMPLFAGYLQYNILDVDKGYVYNGCYYGRKRIAGVSGGIAYQKASNQDAYLAFSAAAFAAIPLAGVNPKGGDEVHALVQYTHYDGGGEPGMLNGTSPTLRNQNDVAFELGYYNRASKVSVFGGFETRIIAEDADKAIVPSQQWFGGGVKYHLIDNLMNFTLAYKRSQFPDEPAGTNPTNQFVLAVQALYF